MGLGALANVLMLHVCQLTMLLHLRPFGVAYAFENKNQPP